jgi:hypothetical protein
LAVVVVAVFGDWEVVLVVELLSCALVAEPARQAARRARHTARRRGHFRKRFEPLCMVASYKAGTSAAL